MIDNAPTTADVEQRTKQVHELINTVLNGLRENFDDAVQLTFIARHPANPGATMIITSDDLDDVIDAINITKGCGS